MASYSVGRCWSLCNVGWPSLQCLSGTKHSRQNLSDISSNERIEFFLKLLSVVSAAIYFLKDQWWSSIVYFLCRHSLTSSGTMQREHRLFNQESRCVFSQCLHVNTFAIQKLVHFYCMRRWFRPPKEKKLAFWYMILFADKIDVWLDILISTISGVGANGTCWCGCQWSRVCLPLKAIVFWYFGYS